MAPPKLPIKPMRPKPPKPRRRLNDRLSIVVPTAGRLSLERTLQSINHQRRHDDEVIVVGDTHDGPLPQTYALCCQYGARYLTVDAGQHDYGHSQANAGIAAATGDWVFGNDDDDVFTPDAFASIRRAIQELDEPRPLMFRFMSWMDVVFWDEPRLAECHIGGHCLVTPNLPGRIGRYGARYNGDYDYLRSTIDLWPGRDSDIVWRENLIAWARPTDAEWAGLLSPKREAACA